MKYALCVVHYGDSAPLLECLQSSFELATPPVARYVLWNDPQRPNSELPAALLKHVTLITPQINLGYAGGANLAVQTALDTGRCEAVWLLNNDTILDRDCADVLIGVLDADASVALVGPRLIDHESGRIWHDGGEIIWPSGQPVSFGYGAEDNAAGDPVETGFVCGCAPLIRGAAFRSVGGFDERFFLCYEDADLSLRLKRRGWRLSHAPKARVRHRGSLNIGAGSAQQRYYMLRNRLLFIELHAPPGGGAHRAARRLRREARLRALRYQLTGRRDEARALRAALADAAARRWGERRLDAGA
ncbi:MAG: glycosyltransferase family 2 protein [Planctomycetota bacterium]